MPLPHGKILHNRYQILHLLSQGGFGAVYRAWDLNLDRPLALKENLDTAPEAQRQFQREAQLLFDLAHPNLPRLYDCFSVRGQGQYLVMEYVDGEDLLQLQRRTGGPLAEAQVLAWGQQVCTALAYLHSRQPPVIHRDVKPANIKITPDGQVKLVDFGIAKLYDPQRQTTVGARAVTPGFSPPEQYGQGVTDARSDVYALGATLYQLVTGYVPLESIERSLGNPLPAPRELNPSLSPQSERAILLAMEMKPGERFASALEFQAALQGAAAGQMPAAQPRSEAFPALAGGLFAHTPPAVAQALAPVTAAPVPACPVPTRPGRASRRRAEQPRRRAARAGRRLARLLVNLVMVLGLAWWVGGRVSQTASLSLSSVSAGLGAAAAATRLPATPESIAHLAVTQAAVVQPAVVQQTAVEQEQPAGQAPVEGQAPPLAGPPGSSFAPAPGGAPGESPGNLPGKLPGNSPSVPPQSGQPRLQLEADAACRGGPGAEYAKVWSFAAGSQLEITGQSGTGWWLVRFYDSRSRASQCWIKGGVVLGEAGNIPLSDFVLPR